MSEHVEQFEQLRPQLFALAYRAMGTRADAEDLVQEAFLRWQNTSEPVASPKAYLMTVVSRLAVDSLRSARTRREQYVGVWLPEPLATTPPPDAPIEMAESLSMAFLFLLESLDPRERIAFLLREVFGYEYETVAQILATTEANARQMVSRARKHVRERRPRFTVEPEQHRVALEQFARAVSTGDVQGLLQLLRDDATAYSDGGGKAAAALNPVRSADHICRFFIGIGRKGAGEDVRWEIRDAAASPALWLYHDGKLASIFNFELADDGRIQTIFVTRNPDKMPHAAS